MTALDQISAFAIGYAVLVALAAAYVLVRRLERPSWLDSMVWLLEALMLLRAVAGAGRWLAGHPPDEVAQTVGYLVASVAVAPIVMDSVDEDRGPWSTAVVLVTAVALAAVAWRLVATT